MKSNILKYILVLSLLLNVSLLGSAVYTHYKEARYHHMAQFSGPHGTLAPFAPYGPGMLFEELSLKPEQMKLFQQKALLFHSALMKKREEVDRLRGSMLALMRADNPDNKAIEATITEINQKQEEMQRTVISHMIEFKSMLNKDQQKKFMDMIENAMGEHREAVCP
ncbi:MAG TPA: periplasmic heavy metal sensor [Syntrophorhabdaceae bacterium]|nr:periplasmic heavy metal sensor [Syntrophorhabdaceae bacterium]